MQNHRRNVPLMLQLYFNRILNATYWILGMVVDKKSNREKSTASSVRYFCLWESVRGLQFQDWGLTQTTSSLALLVAAVFVFCHRLVVFFACWNFSAIWAQSTMINTKTERQAQE